VNYVLGYDLGTSYFKAAVVDETGRVCGIGRGRTPKQTDGSLVTITPQNFWDGLRTCTAEALGKAGITAREISGISYASQANTFLLLDKENNPITDFYVWSTVFSTVNDPQLTAFWSTPEFRKRSGMSFTGAGNQLAKLLWIRSNMPDVWNRAVRVMTVSDYLIYGLTGEFAADPSTSSLIGYLDIHRLEWMKDLLELLGLDLGMFPKVVPMGSYVGKTIEAAGPAAGLVSGIPLFAGALDHIAAGYGAGLGSLSDMSESTGTVLACLTLRKEAEPQPGTAVGPALQSGEYTRLAFSSPGAEVIEELHEARFSSLTIDEMLALVKKSPPGANGLVYDDQLADRPFASRFVLGNNAEPADADYVRAVVEAVVYRLLKMAEASAGSLAVHRISATGGANRSIDLLQLMSDAFGAEVVFCEQKELGAFGAALFAALGCGWFGSVTEAQNSWVKVQIRVVPDPDSHQAYRSLARE
jgi:sugar (pentulose or hexulose) kinase